VASRNRSHTEKDFIRKDIADRLEEEEEPNEFVWQLHSIHEHAFITAVMSNIVKSQTFDEVWNHPDQEIRAKWQKQ
jgi:hypothetical protein